MRNKRVLLKHSIAHLYVVIVPLMGFTMAGGGWVVVVVWVWWGRVGLPNTAEPNMAVLWWNVVYVLCVQSKGVSQTK